MSSSYRSAARRQRSIAAALLGVLLAGCSAGAVDTAPPGTKASPTPAAAHPTAKPTAPTDRTRSRTAPTRVTIASIGVDSSLLRLGLNADGTVEVPPADEGMTAGWYTGGAVPGEPGAAVIIGHNDTRFGRGVFHDLKRLAPGADVSVRDSRGATAHFTVTAVETVRKDAFPTKKVYGATDTPTLRLITCAGAFDAQGHPVDNFIVYAARTPGR